MELKIENLITRHLYSVVVVGRKPEAPGLMIFPPATEVVTIANAHEFPASPLVVETLFNPLLHP